MPLHNFKEDPDLLTNWQGIKLLGAALGLMIRAIMLRIFSLMGVIDIVDAAIEGREILYRLQIIANKAEAAHYAAMRARQKDETDASS